MKVTLNNNEIHLARTIAEGRTKINREHGVKDLIHTKDVNKAIEWQFQGMAAEIAFCKIFNIYPDLTTDIRSASKGLGRSTYDCILPNGKTVDVKQTRHKNGHLITGTWNDSSEISERGDYFALMVGEAPTFELKGFMRQEDLIKEDKLKNFGKGLTYAAKQDELLSYIQITSAYHSDGKL